MIWGAARRRARVDLAVAAYTQWRVERDAVRDAYRVRSAFGEPLAFETYQSAIDREERAATTVRRPDEPPRAPGGDRSRASLGADAGASGAW
jgi:hypothetical protein